MPVVKLTDEQMAAVGAVGAADFTDKLSAFAAKAQANEKAMADSPSLQAILDRLTAVEGKIISEDRVKAIVGEQIVSAVVKGCETYFSSEACKNAIHAEASRTVMATMAATGTTPVKASPAPAGDNTPEQKAAVLNAEGKYEEAWKADKNLRAEFPTAKSYSAFMRHRHQVRVSVSEKDFKRN